MNELAAKQRLYRVIDKIKSKRHKITAEILMANAPIYFWEMPSSTSGKYHPKDELEPGGLVVHTERVCKLIPFTLPMLGVGYEKHYDLMLLCGLAHDMFRAGIPPDLYIRDGVFRTDPKHPIYPSKVFTQKQLQLKAWEFYYFCQVTKGHYGPFSDPIDLYRPTDRETAMFFVTDMLASRRELTFNDSH